MGALLTDRSSHQESCCFDENRCCHAIGKGQTVKVWTCQKGDLRLACLHFSIVPELSANTESRYSIVNDSGRRPVSSSSTKISAQMLVVTVQMDESLWNREMFKNTYYSVQYSIHVHLLLHTHIYMYIQQYMYRSDFLTCILWPIRSEFDFIGTKWFKHQDVDSKYTFLVATVNCWRAQIMIP